MLNLIIRKWVEPYKLIEIIRENSTIEEFSFDGTNKNILKAHFLKQLKEDKDFGLYMKNVNKFYLFDTSVNVKEILIEKFNLIDSDYEITEDEHTPFDDVDSGKAEAAILSF